MAERSEALTDRPTRSTSAAPQPVLTTVPYTPPGPRPAAKYPQLRIVPRCRHTRSAPSVLRLQRVRAPPRSILIRLPHSPPSCLHRAPARYAPTPSLLAPPAPPLRISASTAAPSAPPPCATTSSNHHPATARPPRRAAARFAVASGRLRAGAAPCLLAQSHNAPAPVSAPQAHLTRAPPVRLLPVQVVRRPGAARHGWAWAGCGGPLRASASQLAPA